MYHALSTARGDFQEMKSEIHTISEKLNEGTDFISSFERWTDNARRQRGLVVRALDL